MTTYTLWYEDDLEFRYFRAILRATRATIDTQRQMTLVAVNHIAVTELDEETCRDFKMSEDRQYQFLFRVLYARDHSDAYGQVDDLIVVTVEKEDFLEQMLDHATLTDVETGAAFYQFIIKVHGECPYSVAELDAWLGEDEEEEGKEEQ